MRLLCICDPHSSDRPPVRRTESYNDEVFAKLEDTVGLVKQHHVDVVVFTGDLFHSKRADRISHALVQRWLRLLDQFGVPVLILPGNHDLSGGSLISISRMPIGTILLSDKVRQITPEPWFIPSNDGVAAAIAGWPGTADPEVKDLVGMFEGLALNYCRIMVTHVALDRQDIVYPYPTIHAEDLAPEADLFLVGHMHIPWKPFKLRDSLFVNPGALARASLTVDDAERIPEVALIEIKGTNPSRVTGVKYLPLPSAKQVEFVFRIDEALRSKSNKEEIDRFLDSLRDTEIGLISLADLISVINQMDSVEVGVRQEAIRILESVE